LEKGGGSGLCQRKENNTEIVTGKKTGPANSHTGGQERKGVLENLRFTPRLKRRERGKDLPPLAHLLGRYGPPPKPSWPFDSVIKRKSKLLFAEGRQKNRNRSPTLSSQGGRGLKGRSMQKKSTWGFFYVLWTSDHRARP